MRTLVADWGTEDESVGRLMIQLQGAPQIPLLAIFPAGRPNEPILLQSLYSKQQLLRSLKEAVGGKVKPNSEAVTQLP